MDVIVVPQVLNGVLEQLERNVVQLVVEVLENLELAQEVLLDQLDCDVGNRLLVKELVLHQLEQQQVQ